MGPKHIAGSANPFVTGRSREVSDRDATIVEVTGLYKDLEKKIPERGSYGGFCPGGYIVESSSLQATGDGMGVLRISCANYGSDGSLTIGPEHTTFSVDMMEVQQDLQCHPALKGHQGEILKWLATEEKWRYNPDGSDSEQGDPKNAMFRYADDSWDGTVDGLQIVKSEEGIAFCKAWIDNIHTFNRYYPVVTRRERYKRLPGASMNGASTTGGSAKCAANCGHFEVPPLTLNGWPTTNHWFKGKDTWEQNADTTWEHTEQWVYTPVTDHNWIYTMIEN